MSEHTPGAIRAAEIITAAKYEDHKSTYATLHGCKTTEGIADLIDRETAAPELLEALQLMIEVWKSMPIRGLGKPGTSATLIDDMARAAIDRATS